MLIDSKIKRYRIWVQVAILELRITKEWEKNIRKVFIITDRFSSFDCVK